MKRLIFEFWTFVVSRIEIFLENIRKPEEERLRNVMIGGEATMLLLLLAISSLSLSSSSARMSSKKRLSTNSKTAKTPVAKARAPVVSPGKGGGNNSCARYCGPKLFVGGAFAPLVRDMSARRMPPGVGYHLHPMGFAVAKDGGFAPKLLSNFSTKQYFYEADLDAWTDGSNPLQTNSPGVWGSFLNEAAGGWKCALFAPWAKSSDVANPESAIRKYNQVFSKIRAWGCKQCFLFWSPPSEPQYNSTVLKNQTYAKIAKATGATGIVVDHPAQRTDSFEVSIAALKWAKSNGLAAGWCLNGSASTQQVASLMKRIKDSGVKLDFVSSDNFSNQGSGWSAAATELSGMKGF